MPAHFEIVDGLRMPAKLGGHPVLDFCNTFAGWDGHFPWDYLESYAHLATWAVFSELITPERAATLRRMAAEDHPASERALHRARDFRTHTYDVLAGAADGQRAFAEVADQVHRAARQLRLRDTASGISWEIDPGAGLDAPLAAVAWSAGALLTSPQLAHVRPCPGHGCGWLFLDLRGRRRWCTMATCGNRAKVKRFAERERAGN